MLKAKYNNLEELLKEVQATRGIDTSIEFITHVQDLIGHSTSEELHDLSRQYKETFYRVYDEAEGIEATIRFYKFHSAWTEDLQTRLAEAEADRDKFEFMYDNLKETLETTTTDFQDLQQRNKDNLKELVNKQQEIDELKKELTTLKAKLYDLMTA